MVSREEEEEFSEQHGVAPRARLSLALAGVIGVTVLVGLALSGTASNAATARTANATSYCGTKPGVAATGTPINIGTIDTQQAGTDFSDVRAWLPRTSRA